MNRMKKVKDLARLNMNLRRETRKKEHEGKERRESSKRGEIREKRKWVVVFLKVVFEGREERKKMKERDGGLKKRGGDSRASFLFLFVYFLFFNYTIYLFADFFFNLIFHLFNLKNDYIVFLIK